MKSLVIGKRIHCLWLFWACLQKGGMMQTKAVILLFQSVTGGTAKICRGYPCFYFLKEKRI